VRFARALPLLCSIAVVAVACSTAAPGGSPDANASRSPKRELVVYAASSLTTSFQALARAYEAANPDAQIVLAFDSSSALRARIEQGAPADVLASAGGDAIDRLVRAGLTRGAPAAFAQNRLALIVPTENPAGIGRAEDLARPGVRVVAAAEGVPISEYADELLTRVATSPYAAPGFVAKVEANVVSREDNVRAVVAKIQLGEGDGAIVYDTDAHDAPDVRSIPLGDINVNVVYAAIAVANGASSERGIEFVRWLRDAPAQEILRAAGFGGAP
jgi:molybdate transport system substrate-binding protein